MCGCVMGWGDVSFKTDAQEGLMEVAFKSTPEQDQAQVGGEAGENPKDPPVHTKSVLEEQGGGLRVEASRLRERVPII